MILCPQSHYTALIHSPAFSLWEVKVTRDKDEAINSYITYMLSLEEHIQKAVNGQLEDLADYPEVTRDLRQVLRKVDQHISDLRELSTRRSATGPTDAIKRAGSILLGLGAAAVDLVRKEGLAKNLLFDDTASTVVYTLSLHAADPAGPC